MISTWTRAGMAGTLCLLATVAGCRATSSDASPPPEDVVAIRAMLEELYRAFSFDPDGEPDWDRQRAIYVEGASFVPSLRPERRPIGQTTDEFLADFHAFATSEEARVAGLHERIVGVRIEVFGSLAHAWVAFEGFEPPDGEATTRGLDSLQLVRDGEEWKLASFATQFEREGLALPSRFLVD